VLERPLGERPQHETLDNIMDWLAGPARLVPSLIDEFDEFAWRTMAAGFPLLRVTLSCARCIRNILGPISFGGEQPDT
jgi:hypothetical protein